ncbi:Tfp pilus assembly protein PilN [Mucilaginibacter sp. OK098]|nr:Tfp pilus assembly protein PilN [Mucilaginibacter sp. OK098]
MNMLQQYYGINEATGISITIGKDGNYIVNVCAVSIQNDQLSFQKKLLDITDINELKKLLPVKSYVSLNLYGKGILQKQIEKTEEINQHNFSQILPNANIEDFYVQNFISGNKSFVSVVRKAEADKWISQLKELGFIALMLGLGPFPVQNVTAQLNVYGNDVIFDGHIIHRNEESEWISVKYHENTTSEFPLKIESESISEKLLIAYASAFQLVLSAKIDGVQAEVPGLNEELKKVLEEKKLKVYGFLTLAIFFILLLVNFFLFSGLNSSNAKLTEQVSRTAQSSSGIQQINDQVQQKDSLLKTLGWEGNINKASLIDQIASLLPEEITWKEAAVDPVDMSASRIQKSIVFYTRKIRITGNSEKIIPVNEWIARIKTKAWVKNVQLDSYTFNSEQNTGQFTILIDY